MIQKMNPAKTERACGMMRYIDVQESVVVGIAGYELPTAIARTEGTDKAMPVTVASAGEYVLGVEAVGSESP